LKALPVAVTPLTPKANKPIQSDAGVAGPRLGGKRQETVVRSTHRLLRTGGRHFFRRANADGGCPCAQRQPVRGVEGHCREAMRTRAYSCRNPTPLRNEKGAVVRRGKCIIDIHRPAKHRRKNRRLPRSLNRREAIISTDLNGVLQAGMRAHHGFWI